MRYAPPNLLDYVASEPCVYHEFRFTYKRVWYDASAFANGFYNFSFLPFFYELLRRIIRERLDYARLFAPLWLVDETYHILRRRPICPCRTLPRAGSTISGFFTFDEIRKSVLSRTDAHVAEFSKWVLSGGGFRVATNEYNPEARTGRFFWEPEGTTYWAGSSSSSYHTGGMASEFDRRMSLMLEQEKFTLLTASVSDITREQYIRCWRRWTRFCACMGVSPWLDSPSIGWGNVLIDFVVWEYKILGI